MLAELRRILEHHEGSELEAYYCPAGHLTVGIGHNCEASPVQGVRSGRHGKYAPPGTPTEQRGDEVTHKMVNDLFAEDVSNAWRSLDKRIPWWSALCVPRRIVLMDMAFNMGVSGLLGFPGMLEAVKAGDWRRAVIEMYDSKWAGKDLKAPQVQPERIANLSWMMFTGEYVKL